MPTQVSDGKNESGAQAMSSSDRSLFSRRSFLRWSQSAMALFGAAPVIGAAEAVAAPAADSPADRLLRQAWRRQDHQCCRNLHNAYCGLHAAAGPSCRRTGRAPPRPALRSPGEVRGVPRKEAPLRRRRCHLRRVRRDYSRHRCLHGLGQWQQARRRSRRMSAQ